MTLHATCHCGATRIEVDRAPATATACNCTFCTKRGALWAYYDPSEVRVVEAAPADYAPHGLNHHHFCAACGCTTVTHAPDWTAAGGAAGEGARDAAQGGEPNPAAAWSPEAVAALPRRVSVNVRLFDDLDWEVIPVVRLDGRNLW